MMTDQKPASLARLERAIQAIPELSDYPLRYALKELTLEIPPSSLLSVMRLLRDTPTLDFAAIIDVTAVDYLAFPQHDQPRFMVVYHLLSVQHNHRLRVKTSPDTTLAVPSLTSLWPAANWMERETFDMFGVHFEGHPDLRRILTDYGFEGHPCRKDFPVTGNLELRYDEEARKLVYEPVTIEARENIHRVFREPGFADTTPMSPPEAPVPTVIKKD